MVKISLDGGQNFSKVINVFDPNNGYSSSGMYEDSGNNSNGLRGKWQNARQFLNLKK